MKKGWDYLKIFFIFLNRKTEAPLGFSSLLYYFLCNALIPSFKAEINISASSFVFSGQRETRMDESASLSVKPKDTRAELTLFEWDEQAEPEETYIPFEER